mgnify:CR=1 FL=1
MPPVKPVLLRALVDLDLRARPDPTCEDWLHWDAGEVFTPPSHFRVDKALERGVVEEVKD